MACQFLKDKLLLSYSKNCYSQMHHRFLLHQSSDTPWVVKRIMHSAGCNFLSFYSFCQTFTTWLPPQFYLLFFFFKACYTEYTNQEHCIWPLVLILGMINYRSIMWCQWSERNRVTATGDLLPKNATFHASVPSKLMTLNKHVVSEIKIRSEHDW